MRLRYRVVVKGTTISRHTTKPNAVKTASRIRGSKIFKIRSSRYKKRRRRY